MATLETEIRKLEPNYLCTLAEILEPDLWKKVMASVPSDENENQCIFTNDHIKMIEGAIRQQGRSGAEIFLTEWSTYGKNRPTCRSMLDLLVKLEMFRAADYLAVKVLKMDPPERPISGPAAQVQEYTIEEILNPKVAQLHIDYDLEEFENTTSSSIRIEKNAINVIPNYENEENSHMQLMNYKQDSDSTIIEQNGSNLMLFSDYSENFEKSEEISDMIKFSNVKVSYNLKEAKSEDIPLCVLQNNFESGVNMENSLKTTELQKSSKLSIINSTNYDSDVNASDIKVVSDNISDIGIPLVVQEFDSKKNNDT